MSQNTPQSSCPTNQKLAKVDWSALPFQGHPEIMAIWGPRDHAENLAKLIDEQGGIQHALLCAKIKGQSGKPILYDGFTRLSIWFDRQAQGKKDKLPPFIVENFDNLGEVKARALKVQADRRNITSAQLAQAQLDIKREQGYAIVARSQGRPSKEKRNDSLLKTLPDAKALAKEFGVSDPIIRTLLKVQSTPDAKLIHQRMLLPVSDPQYLSPIQAENQVNQLNRDWIKNHQIKIAQERQKKAQKITVQTVDEIKADGIFTDDAVAGMKKVESGTVDLMLTSPPYANTMPYDMGDVWNGDYPSYLDTFVRKPLAEAVRILKHGGRVALNFDNTYRSREKKKAGIKSDTVANIYNCWKDYSKIAEDEFGLLPIAYHIWYKQNCPNYFAHGSRDHRWPVYNPNTEFVLVWAKGSVRHSSGAKGITDEEYDRFTLSHWYISPHQRLPIKHPDYHPCPFPEELAYRVIKLYSPKDGTVLDPFNGSGTTTFVAAALGRNYIGIDKSPLQVGTAQRRIATLDGLNASQKLKQITRFVPAQGERIDGMKKHVKRKGE